MMQALMLMVLFSQTILSSTFNYGSVTGKNFREETGIFLIFSCTKKQKKKILKICN